MFQRHYLCILALVSTVFCDEDVAVHIPHFSTENEMMTTMASLVDGQSVLVLTYGNGGEKCEKTVEKLGIADILSQMTKFSEEEFGVARLVAAMLSDKAYEKKHSLKNCPNLVLYREGRPIVYDGDNLHMGFSREDIGQWVAMNMKSNVHHVSEETFEHETQASTGSTTGDWFIWLHKSSCSDLTAVWEAVASRLKYSKVIGEVDLTLNPKLAERFHINDCQSLLLFRQGRYYTYTGDAFNVHALTNFAEISFKNFNSQIVRPPPSPFDEKVEQLTVWLKESEYGLYVLIGVTFSLFGGILILVCKESRDAAEAEKKEN